MKQSIPFEMKVEIVEAVKRVSGKEAKVALLAKTAAKYGIAMPEYWKNYPDSPIYQWGRDVKIGPSARAVAASHNIDYSKLADGIITVDGTLFLSRDNVDKMIADAVAKATDKKQAAATK